jgi:hypothetical protein
MMTMDYRMLEAVYILRILRVFGYLDSTDVYVLDHIL